MQATRLRWVYGASRRPRYIGCGLAWPLYASISDIPGARGQVERIALATIGRHRSSKPVPLDVLDAWHRLQRVYPDAITAALFVYTGYYKDTVLSGIVRARQTHFVKIFASSEGHHEEAFRFQQLRAVVPTSITLAPLLLADEGVVAYRLLSRSRAASLASLLDAALSIGSRALQVADAAPTDAAPTGTRDEMPQVGELMAEFGLSAAVVDHLYAGVPGRQAVAHGDFTPWNAFCTSDDALAVVDYERVGVRAPFADVWHVVTQPCALHRRTQLPETLFSLVASSSGASREEVVGWYMRYLLEELRIDLTDWVVHGRRHPQLRDLIDTKSALLAHAQEAVPTT